MSKANYERCVMCKRECQSGVWLAPQFDNEKVLLFCSEECKNKYIQKKLERIKMNYPSFYEKVKDKGAFWISERTKLKKNSSFLNSQNQRVFKIQKQHNQP
ncbi:hypothetical protein DRJ25_01675 [Candidatus Woesearchaeota archaeon]|nr:MAG: hypothetical protein DRJ25_01675 [Candidatus Woesearchaeota archaeon]